jgi:hypothetical protein
MQYGRKNTGIGHKTLEAVHLSTLASTISRVCDRRRRDKTLKPKKYDIIPFLLNNFVAINDSPIYLVTFINSITKLSSKKNSQSKKGPFFVLVLTASMANYWFFIRKNNNRILSFPFRYAMDTFGGVR